MKLQVVMSYSAKRIVSNLIKKKSRNELRVHTYLGYHLKLHKFG